MISWSHANAATEAGPLENLPNTSCLWASRIPLLPTRKISDLLCLITEGIWASRRRLAGGCYTAAFNLKLGAPAHGDERP